MADPVSLFAAALTITTATLESIRVLYNTIDKIKNAPDVIGYVRSDLGALEPILRRLDARLRTQDPAIIEYDAIEPAVRNCDRACKAFSSWLERCMRHSSETKTFWLDRWKVAMLGQERAKAFRGQLSDCKSTLSVALSAVTTLSNSRNEDLFEDLKTQILQAAERSTQKRIEQAACERADVERSLQSCSPDNTHQDTSSADRQELLDELHHQRTSNEILSRTAEEAVSKLHYERTGQRIKGLRATDHSIALTGLINAPESAVRTDQDISDVSADNWGVVAAGIVGNVNLTRSSTFESPNSGTCIDQS